VQGPSLIEGVEFTGDFCNNNTDLIFFNGRMIGCDFNAVKIHQVQNNYANAVMPIVHCTSSVPGGVVSGNQFYNVGFSMDIGGNGVQSQGGYALIFANFAAVTDNKIANYGTGSDANYGWYCQAIHAEGTGIEVANNDIYMTSAVDAAIQLNNALEFTCVGNRVRLTVTAQFQGINCAACVDGVIEGNHIYLDGNAFAINIENVIGVCHDILVAGNQIVLANGGGSGGGGRGLAVTGGCYRITFKDNRVDNNDNLRSNTGIYTDNTAFGCVFDNNQFTSSGGFSVTISDTSNANLYSFGSAGFTAAPPATGAALPASTLTGSGVNTSTLTGAATLAVTSSTGFTTAGSLLINMGAGSWCVVTYNGLTGGFQNCQYRGGTTGVIPNTAAVVQLAP
jgi:hypothetical protein